MFANFGANLPAPTLIVIAISDFFVSYWWLMTSVVIGAIFAFLFPVAAVGSLPLRDRPHQAYGFLFVGPIVEKATIARWTRTLATMFAAGVPLVESLDAVAGASGNAVFIDGTRKIQNEVSTGTSLTNAMHNTGMFPTMVLQMTQIGEESGALDGDAVQGRRILRTRSR